MSNRSNARLRQSKSAAILNFGKVTAAQDKRNSERCNDVGQFDVDPWACGGV